MDRIISALNASNLFSAIDVLELIDEDWVKLLKIKAKALDGAILYITEFHTRDYQKYSYHFLLPVLNRVRYDFLILFSG